MFSYFNKVRECARQTDKIPKIDTAFAYIASCGKQEGHLATSFATIHSILHINRHPHVGSVGFQQHYPTRLGRSLCSKSYDDGATHGFSARMCRQRRFTYSFYWNLIYYWHHLERKYKCETSWVLCVWPSAADSATAATLSTSMRPVTKSAWRVCQSLGYKRQWDYRHPTTRLSGVVLTLLARRSQVNETRTSAAVDRCRWRCFVISTSEQL